MFWNLVGSSDGRRMLVWVCDPRRLRRFVWPSQSREESVLYVALRFSAAFGVLHHGYSVHCPAVPELLMQSFIACRN